MNENNFSEIFKNLSDPNRITIIKFLTKGEVCANDILTLLSVTQPTLSHHMKILTEANIVSARKSGKNTYYSLNTQIAFDITEFIGNIFNLSDYIEVNRNQNKSRQRELPSHLL